MKVTISNIVRIEEPTQVVKTLVDRNLTFKNPDYTKKVQMGFYVGNTPRTLKLYSYDGSCIYTPIGFVDAFKKYFPADTIYEDLRAEVYANITSKMTLRDYQEYAMIPFATRFHHHDNGLLIAYPGLGKTNMALEIASRIKQKTLFITHTKELCTQACDRCKEVLNCTTSYITEGKVDTSGDIVFATVQTLVKNLDKIKHDTFGCVITDECHHLFVSGESVGMFQECIEHFSARHKLGMTGTLHRADGLSVCIPYLIGPVAYETKEDKTEYVVYIDDKEFFRFDKSKYLTQTCVKFIETSFSLLFKRDGHEYYRDVFNKDGSTISFSKLINEVANDNERNKTIIDIANSVDGSTIILSDRVEQLKYLQKHIKNSVVITGSTKKDVRTKALDDVKCGKVKTLCASYKIAKEGLDCPILANLILATPVKDAGIVEQCVGRIRRVSTNKTQGVVYDLVDKEVSTLDRFYRKRKTLYKRKGWL